jgi:hypothetical protein
MKNEFKGNETLSNSELNIKLKQLEDRYIKKQTEIKKMLNELSYIDKEYVAIKDILNNRKKYF